MAEDYQGKLKQSWVVEFLSRPLLARLATCNPKTLQPHVVPVWYAWDGEQVWVSSFRSTRKVKEILMNPKASIVIDTDEIDRSTLGVIFEGSVELITDHQEARRIGMHIYTRYLGFEGANTAEPQSWLNDPEHLIIRLTPQKAMIWRG